jgi:hypothetical protein
MANTDQVTIEGIFPDRTLADKTVGELKATGFRPDQIEISTAVCPAPRSPAPMHEHVNPTPPCLKARGGAMLGGIIGAVVGCLIGVWFGQGFNRSIHDIALAQILGAVAGIVILGTVGALIGWAVTGKRYDFYTRDLHSGPFAVKVRGNGNLAAAMEIMRNNRGDVFERRVVEDTPTTQAGRMTSPLPNPTPPTRVS